VIKSPSFDPVLYPFKVTNFFIFFNKCLAPYVRRHHEAEEKVGGPIPLASHIVRRGRGYVQAIERPLYLCCW
jgi:hypothetical protein